MSERAFLTAILWFFSSIVLGALFISAAAQGELTTLHTSLALLIISIVAVASVFLSRWKDGAVALEKSKRERIDTMLRDMSDTELLELKQRLSIGNLSDDAILDYLGEDGELVARK